MWQKCPICNGTGVVSGSMTMNSSSVCKVCNGKVIINKITGLPPRGVETFASPKYRNADGSPITAFRDNCEQFENK